MHYADDPDDNYNQKPEAPEEGDYTITACGPLGGRTCVGEVGGRYYGDFTNDKSALSAICKKMRAEGFFPNVWSISDHGNAEIIDPKCRMRRKVQ